MYYFYPHPYPSYPLPYYMNMPQSYERQFRNESLMYPQLQENNQLLEDEQLQEIDDFRVTDYGPVIIYRLH